MPASHAGLRKYIRTRRATSIPDGMESALSDAAFHADTLERIAALHRIGEPMKWQGRLRSASPAASLITGETILIDGGWTAR